MFDYELLDLGERILAWGRSMCEQGGVAIEVDVPIGGVFEFRDGKIMRCEDFGSKDQALKAVGLEE